MNKTQIRLKINVYFKKYNEKIIKFENEFVQFVCLLKHFLKKNYNYKHKMTD